MPSMRLRGGIAGLAALALALPLATAPSADAAPPAPAKAVARVQPAPVLKWFPCYDEKECATVKVPLDYDQPKGATVEVAVLRSKAKGRKIGSLFLNPGGPGGSGVGMASAAELFLSPTLLEKFDVIGMDPRGIANSSQVKCFPSVRQQTLVMQRFVPGFPVGRVQERTHIAATSQYARACSTTGKPLSASMSTANVARDMDLIRRSLGEKQMNFLGFSYGSYLGNVYANMYPDKVRSIVLDGVLDPVAWAGTKQTRHIPSTIRIKSGEGAYKALKTSLRLCDQAGTELCPIAGNALQKYDTVAQRLKEKPVEVDGFGTFTYAAFVQTTLQALYGPGVETIAYMTDDLLTLTDPAVTATAERRERVEQFRGRLAQVKQQVSRGYDFPYDNGLDTFSSVLCTDTLNPASPTVWGPATAKADARAPYFGRSWGWSSVQCATRSWKAVDEDAYRGTYSKRTAHPVLVVGNIYDPATNYDGAVKAASLLPNSRLLSSDSWGHTAYGTSACVTDAVDAYLVTGKLPAKGTMCKGDYVPYAEPPVMEPQSRRRSAPEPDAPARRLPPVFPIAPLR